jgi:signal transduction histidine kinase
MLVPKNIRSEHDDYLENYIKTGQAKIIGIGREVEAVRKNGRHFPIYLALSEILLPSGGRHFVGIIRDESKKKDMESELLRAHKLEAVGHLAAGIAHEINTPIQFVSDNLTFLNNAFENLLGLLSLYEKLAACVARNQDTTKMMTEIRAKVEAADLEYLLEEIPNAAGQSLEGIHRISVIVRAMKEFSHPGSASKEWVDINHAISTTITIASNEWKYVAQLKTYLDPSLPSVMVCLTEINQTVLNMIVNAAHTIAERRESEKLSELGEITISTRQLINQVEIKIGDTGQGMPADLVDKIFTPFFTTKAVGKGTGQGLAIAYKAIVESHHGDIKVDSEIGKGTIFTILLPISVPTAAPISKDVQ